MKNSVAIPKTGTKDEINLKRLLSSLNDREIQEIYTHVRIEELCEDILTVAGDMLVSKCITEEDYELVEENKRDFAAYFMKSHDIYTPDADSISAFIEIFLNDMHSPVVMICCHNHDIYIRKYKNCMEAFKVMRYSIHDVMIDYNINIDASISNYSGINCGWNSKSGWLHYDGDNYDWKIVSEFDIPSNS